MKLRVCIKEVERHEHLQRRFAQGIVKCEVASAAKALVKAVGAIELPALPIREVHDPLTRQLGDIQSKQRRAATQYKKEMLVRRWLELRNSVIDFFTFRRRK